MATLFSDITTQVQNTFNDSSGEFLVFIQQYVNDAVQDIVSRREWPFMKVWDASFTTTASTAEYSVASDVFTLKQLRLTASDANDIYLDELNENQFYSGTPGPDTTNNLGTPNSWFFTDLDSNQSPQVYLYPIPDDAYTIEYEYYKKATVMTDSTDVCVIPDRYINVVVDYAVSKCYEREGLLDYASYFNTNYENGLRRMMNDYVKVTRTPFFVRFFTR